MPSPHVSRAAISSLLMGCLAGPPHGALAQTPNQTPATPTAPPASAITPAQPAPLAVYAGLPAARGARLSPDGKLLAYIGPVRGRNAFVIWPLDAKEKSKAKVIKTGDGEPQWVLWKSDQRLLASLRVVSTRGPLMKTVDTRLVSIDASTGEVVEMVRADEADYPPQIQDHLLSSLPGDPGHVLLQLPKFDRTTRTAPSGDTLNERNEHPEVVRLDVKTGRTETLLQQHGLITHWIADADGQVRLGWAVRRDHKALDLLVRDTPQSPWRTTRTVTLNEGQRFNPLAFVEGQADRLYVESNHHGGPGAIFEFDLASGEFTRTVAADPDGEVSPIRRDGRLVGHEDTHGRRVYFDRAWAADAALIDKALPDSTNRLIDRSADGRRVLVSVVKGNEPLDFWLLTRDKGEQVLEPVTEAYPGLDPSQIAPSRWTRYTARDGLSIPALLTLPVGYQRGKGAPLPFVVLPHGGPSAHDEAGLDHWVQFLASRGYGVLQPQFRGSTGYGQKFLAAGYRQWGLAMQDDVTDGTRWLIDQKLADPRRIALVGGSYGGYATLMGLAKEPGLYRAGAAFAPVTDLSTLVEDQWRYVFGDLNLPQIGGNSKQLEQTSPARLAERITAPVLLVHGRKDFTVPVLHTELMTSALKKAGKPATTLYLDEGDHYLSRGDDRLAWLKALDGFLAANLQ
jgi:dipeptidyl aminopeptidase/acylaminoacyl peptidase